MSGSSSTPKRPRHQPAIARAQLGQPLRERIAHPLLDAVDERLADERLDRLARVADAEVDERDALGGEPPLRLLEPHERIGAEVGEDGGEAHPLDASEPLERLVRAQQLLGLDLLVAPVREAGRAGAEIDRVDPAAREVGDVRPRLLRLDRERPGAAKLLDERGGDDPPRRRVGEDLRAGRDQGEAFDRPPRGCGSARSGSSASPRRGPGSRCRRSRRGSSSPTAPRRR